MTYKMTFRKLIYLKELNYFFNRYTYKVIAYFIENLCDCCQKMEYLIAILLILNDYLFLTV